MLLAHRIALAPNHKQAAYFARASGVARFAYNWALAEWRCEYKEGGKPSEMMLRKRLNALKREQSRGCSKSRNARRKRQSSTSASAFRTSSGIARSQRRNDDFTTQSRKRRAFMIAFARRTKSAPSAVTASASNCLSSAGFGCARLYGSRALPNM